MLSRRTTLSSNGHHSNGHDSQRSSPGRSTMSTKIMRRVSTIFTTGRVGKKQNSLDTIEQGSGRGSMESQLSIDDIRRPSGLGRPVSFSSTTQSLDLEESVPLEVEVHRFQRTASQPNLARTLTQKAIPSMKGRNKPQPPLPREAVMVHIPPLRLARSAPTLVPPPPIPVMPTLPTEVFTCILSFLHRRSVCTLATVNKAFCDAARAVLYGNLDLRVVPSRKYDGLCQMLASRRDLTDLVHTFFLHRWPPSFALSYPDGDPRIAMLSQSTAIFTIALQNMHQLTSLTLPSFDLTILRHHTAFGLRNLTFLNRKLSESEERELFTWLDGQTNIITLRFPNLQESEPRPVSPVADDGEKNFSDFLSPIQSPSAVSQSPQPSPSSFTSTFANIPPAPSLYPYNSPSLLPSLNTLHVTPTLATLLAPVRPVRHIVLNIDSTLYTGLRPAAIMSSLRDLNSLTFHFGKQVDKRTAEKMLLAAGSSLSGLVSENNDKPQEQLSELGLRVHFAGPGTDEVSWHIFSSDTQLIIFRRSTNF